MNRATGLVAVAMVASGCSGHYLQAMAPVHALAREGRSAQAVEQLRARTAGTDWDELLVALDTGALLHRAGRWAESAEVLNRAIDIADRRETVSVGQELFGQAPFRMANYEKQALHALQAINYLMMGQVDEAVVEARLTDLRQRRLQAQAERSASDERFITGSTVDPHQREFFEQLAFGRYISAVAREKSGDLDGAFIDLFRALQLVRGAPADARGALTQQVPRLLALAAQLNRPELAQLQAWYPQLSPEVTPPGEGEVVVLLELGFGPRPVLANRAVELLATPRAELPVHVVAEGPVVPDVVSSLEELALRRGFRGVLLDRERKATVGVNTVLFATYFVVWPVAMVLLVRRGYELAIRDSQSWALLPAELAVARLHLPAGQHRLRVPGLHGLVERQVEVTAGAVTLLVAEGP